MKKVALVIFVFIVTYLITSLSLWIYHQYRSGEIGSKIRLENFVVKYQNELRVNVFGELFSEAQKCQQTTPVALKEDCQKIVGKKLADQISEEELADFQGNDWPNDLFYVKHTAGHYYRLSWNGVITDITDETNVELLRNKQTRWSVISYRFLHGYDLANSPHYFSFTHGLEYYAPVEINDKETGYLVRLSPLTEEGDILFNFLTPLFAFTVLFDGIVYHSSSLQLESLGLLLLYLTNLIFSIIASLITIHLLKKRK